MRIRVHVQRDATLPYNDLFFASRSCYFETVCVWSWFPQLFLFPMSLFLSFIFALVSWSSIFPYKVTSCCSLLSFHTQMKYLVIYILRVAQVALFICFCSTWIQKPQRSHKRIFTQYPVFSLYAHKTLFTQSDHKTKGSKDKLKRIAKQLLASARTLL